VPYAKRRSTTPQEARPARKHAPTTFFVGGALPNTLWTLIGAAAGAAVAAILLVLVAPVFAGLASRARPSSPATVGGATDLFTPRASRSGAPTNTRGAKISESIRGEAALRSANAEWTDTTPRPSRGGEQHRREGVVAHEFFGLSSAIRSS
jgi:hypothetical protein